MLTTKELRGRASGIAAEAILGISDFFNEGRGRVWGIFGVTLGILGFFTIAGYLIPYPFNMVAYLAQPASIVCGIIAYRCGRRGLGLTGIVIGVLDLLLDVFVVVTVFFMLAR